MKLLHFSFLIISANSFYVDNDSKETKKDRIVGGRRASIESLPYQAQFLQNDNQICGATIISKLWIVTAAHCITESSPKWSVITGSAYISTGGDHHEINKVIVHPDYKSDTTNNDIALIKLEKAMVFNECQKSIPLATKKTKAGDVMTVSGYGKKGEDLGYAAFLEVANVPIIDHSTCARRYSDDTITDNMFCAGEGPTDACQGDSGGPGVINGELVGIVSAGMQCGSTYYPGIYTNVYNYRQWIAKHTNYVKPIKLATTASMLYNAQKFFFKNIINKFIHFI